jgi:hypothetical protein
MLTVKMFVRLEFLVTVKTSTVDFWVVTSCGVIGCCRRFGGKCSLKMKVITHMLRLYVRTKMNFWKDEDGL